MHHVSVGVPWRYMFEVQAAGLRHWSANPLHSYAHHITYPLLPFHSMLCLCNCCQYCPIRAWAGSLFLVSAVSSTTMFFLHVQLIDLMIRTGPP